jgi:S-methylmethionine-dependent homocysteine/selenocysteine methylase
MRAVRLHGIPSVISFTVETDGRLPAGDTLAEAITQVDAATDASPANYMINCAHPDHFVPVLDDGGLWLQRLRGVRANASRRSHAELNEAPDLDAGDPDELGRQYTSLPASHTLPCSAVAVGWMIVISPVSAMRAGRPRLPRRPVAC